MLSKFCALKGNQKTFYFNQNKIASCCQADAETLDARRDLDSYLSNWQQESLELDAGNELPGCRSCWEQESQGKISYRANQRNTNIIELFFSNLCNQVCSYCSPKFSSAWQDSISEFGMFKNISGSAIDNFQQHGPSMDIEYWLEQILQYINRCDNNSVEIKLLGGEPLMQQRNLEKLLGMNSHKIKKLIIHTNLNPPTDKFLNWILKNLDLNKLDFHVSIDASPAYNQWPRARFDKTNFERNLRLLQQNHIKPQFHSVISVLSVFDLKNFICWTQHQKIKVVFDKLHNPNCLDASLIPHYFRDTIWKSIKNLAPQPVIQEVLQQENNTDNLKLFEQHNYLTQYFERNNLDPTHCDDALFQKYWAWLTENYKR